MLEFFISVFINFFLPENKFGIFIIFNDFDDVGEEFLNILIFLSFINAIAKSIKFFQWFFDSIFQGLAPG